MSEVEILKNMVRNLNNKVDLLLERLDNKMMPQEKLAAMNDKELCKFYGRSYATIKNWKRVGLIDKYNRLVK